MNKTKNHSNVDINFSPEDKPFNQRFRVGVVLKEVREIRKVRQNQICDGKDIKQSYISQCEKGEKSVNLNIVRAYATACEIPLPELLSYLIEKYREFLIRERTRTEVYLNSNTNDLNDKEVQLKITEFLNQNPKYDVKFWRNFNEEVCESY
ncbi:helix-turn-helix transcriptional regulator [Spongiivirga sp. MCCC 1A20706]|uniref:helix-turn-helix domain-containing protein n=1 Tax=Spongiivirga sp. MCCC 1A20706 TaxID=3160963 RepID=UPI0039773DCB